MTWLTLLGHVLQEAATEARDNCRFLATLDASLQPTLEGKQLFSLSAINCTSTSSAGFCGHLHAV